MAQSTTYGQTTNRSRSSLQYCTSIYSSFADQITGTHAYEDFNTRHEAQIQIQTHTHYLPPLLLRPRGFNKPPKVYIQNANHASKTPLYLNQTKNKRQSINQSFHPLLHFSLQRPPPPIPNPAISTTSTSNSKLQLRILPLSHHKHSTT